MPDNKAIRPDRPLECLPMRSRLGGVPPHRFPAGRISHLSPRGSILLAALIAAAWTTSADAALIRFHSTVEVDAPVVRLGDVAEIHALDAETSERLAAITLAPAPAPGRSTQLEFGQIRSRLQSQGVNLARIEFTGASLISVSSPEFSREPPPAMPSQPSSVSGAERARAEELLKPVIAAYLHRIAPEVGAATIALQFSDEDVPTILNAAGGGFDVAGGAAPWDRPQSLQIVPRSGESTEVISVICRITEVPYVLAAKHAIPARHVLSESDLVWIPRPDSSTHLRTFDQPEAVIGKETTRALRREEPIQGSDIREIPLVRPNDIVSVYSRGPGITIRRQFKSRGEGARGDTVTLVTLDGRQRVMAVVTGYHEAEVIAPGDSQPVTALEDPTGRIEFVSEFAPVH